MTPMSRITSLAVGVMLGSAGLSLPLTAQFEEVRDQMQTAVSHGEAASLAVAVLHAGQIVWEEGFGFADRSREIPATEHTMYSLASISKPITATGLMVLVERGLVDLDRPINEYLGESKLRARVGGDRDATVRRVANHTSGLPLHYQFFYEDERYRPPPMDETIRRYGNLVTAPGERYQYSNLGYGVIDYVISRQSEKPYAEFMREEVFLPLGMTHTSVHPDPDIDATHAIRYGPDGSPIPFYDFDHPGASAVYSSAHDLMLFAMFHMGASMPGTRAILSPETLAAMQEPTADTGPNRGYGIGWGSGRRPSGIQFVGHSGGMGGVSTILTLIPERGVAVAVLSNSSSRWPGRIASQILEALFPEDAAETPASTDGSNAESERFAPDRSLIGEWTGAIETQDRSVPITLSIGSDEVRVTFDGEPSQPLREASLRDEFLRGEIDGTLGFEDAERQPYQIRLELKIRGRVLNGSAIVMSRPENRVGNALTSWVEVRRGVN